MKQKKKIEHNLNELILRSGLKKTFVAKLKGISPVTLSRQISGKHDITIRDLHHYSAILNCDPRDIVKFSNDSDDISNVSSKEQIFKPNLNSLSRKIISLGLDDKKLLYSLEEAAKILFNDFSNGKSRTDVAGYRRLRRMVKAGLIEVIRDGRRSFISKKTLSKFIN